MQRKHVFLLLVSVMLALALAPGWQAMAAPNLQSSINLRNAGFEQGTADGWSHWSKPEEIVTVDKEVDLNQSWYTPMIVPNSDSVRVHSGARALEINNEYRKWRGGVYQQVSVPAGSKVVFKIWAQGYTKSGQAMSVQAGIDPNGGTSVGGAVQWSGVAGVRESYVQLSTPEVTVGSSGKVTVFAWAEAPSPDVKTAAFFDDASLVVTGQASAQPTTPAQQPPAAQPTTPPVAAQPITPAQPQPDGSIVYTVQSGNTLFAIALAHDTSVDEIMRLNGLSDTVISVGQRLIIRGPTVAPTATQPPAPEAPPTQEPTPVPPTGQICIQAFNDRDGDGQPGGVGEDLLPGVVFALSNAQGALKNYTTDGINEPYCFAELVPDTYTVKIVPPSGYTATTLEVWNLGLAAGQTIEVKFGARRGGPVPSPTPNGQPAPGEGGEGNTGSASIFATAGRFVLIVLAVLTLIGLGAAGMYFVSMRR